MNVVDEGSIWSVQVTTVTVQSPLAMGGPRALEFVALGIPVHRTHGNIPGMLRPRPAL